MNLNLEETAATIAWIAHRGQIRKYNKEPYFEHCKSVASYVDVFLNRHKVSSGLISCCVAAAYLHDVIEDTSVEPKALRRLLLDKVPEVQAVDETMSMVLQLTDHYTFVAYPHFNYNARKTLEAERLAHINERAWVIKLADMYDNYLSFKINEPKYAEKFKQYKELTIQKRIKNDFVHLNEKISFYDFASGNVNLHYL